MYADRLVLSSDVVPRHLGFVLYNALRKPYAQAQKHLGDEAAKKAKDLARSNIKEFLKDTKDKMTKRKLVLKAAK